LLTIDDLKQSHTFFQVPSNYKLTALPIDGITRYQSYLSYSLQIHIIITIIIVFSASDALPREWSVPDEDLEGVAVPFANSSVV
jgi:hypothetical protein